MKSFDNIQSTSQTKNFIKFLDSQIHTLQNGDLSFSGENSERKAFDLNKEAILMDRMIKETKKIFKQNYDVNLSFDGKSKSEEEAKKELKVWREKYAEFETLVNQLKKEIGYTDTLNFEGNTEDENPLIPLIEEVKKMIAFMELKKNENLYLDEGEVEPTEPTVEEGNLTPYLIGGALLGGYLLFKN